MFQEPSLQSCLFSGLNWFFNLLMLLFLTDRVLSYSPGVCLMKSPLMMALRAPYRGHWLARVLFPQKGSVEWGNLVTTIFSATVGVLSRYSAGGVDSYTSVVAQAVCNNFKLGTVGRMHLEEALTNLHTFGSLADALWFGFGVKNLVRSLASTEQGAVCLALCTSLSECYHEYACSEIFLELVDKSQAPEDLKPSVHQWKAMIKACAGVFASTSFPNRAAFYVQLYPTSIPRSQRRCSSAKSVANALLAIGKVSRGELASITIMGGADAGYLAAIGEWIFDLSIHVKDSKGRLLHDNQIGANIGRLVQLLIVFDDEESRESSLDYQELSIRTLGKTYFLQDATKLFQEDLPEYYAKSNGGRTSWDRLLSPSFGSDFAKLMTMPRAFGCALGNAARIFKAIAVYEDEVPLKFPLNNRVYCDASYGRGFIENIIRWFPELADLRVQMDEGVKKSYAHSKSMYEANLALIKATCNCSLCQASEDEDGFDDSNDHFCCVVLVDTIIHVARCLSVVTVPKTLYPNRSGLEIFYEKHLNMRRSAELPKVEILSREMGPIIHCLDLGKGYGWEDEDDPVEVSLFQALQLFTGRDIQPLNTGVSAVCESGLCAYLDILRDLSDTDESIRRINIVPGRIELHSKAHSSLEDSKPTSMDGSESWDLPFTSELLSTRYENLSVIVKEQSEALRITYEFQSSVRGKVKKQQTGPAALTGTLMECRGLVPCKRRNCTVVHVSSPFQNISQSHRQLHINGKEIEVFYGNLHSRFALLGVIASFFKSYKILIIDRECLHCCVRAILARNGVDRAIVFVVR